VVDASAKERMREVLTDIQDGTFAREWMLENQVGRPRYNRLMAKRRKHPIEEVGRKLRRRMTWLKQTDAAGGEDTKAESERAA
jgi:ketol-acid reductoisomerase